MATNHLMSIVCGPMSVVMIYFVSYDSLPANFAMITAKGRVS